MQTIATTNLTKKRKKSKQVTPDFILLGIIILIVAFGVIMVYSASFYYCTNKGWSPIFFAKKQLMLGLVGIAAMLFITYKFDYHICTNRTLVRAFYYITLILATSVKFIGIEANGAKRWIQIGPIQIQPSEFVKLAVVLMVSSYIIRNRSHMNKLWTRIKAWIIVVVPTLIVTVLGSNLSSGIVIFGIGAVIIFSASPKIWYYFLAVIAGVLLVVGVRQLAIHTPKGEDPNIPVVNKILKGYRLDRVRAWIDPFSDPQDDGYQAIQALYAVGSGGVFGKGLAQGVQKMGFLPEPYNDIIFAVICEELGLVGALLLMLAYGVIVMRGMAIAMRAPDYTGAFIAVGISSMIGIQAIINVAVNTNTIPTTGMQLPLVSYGGTALVVLLATLGILLNISRYASVEKLN
ncbi:MAG: putative lipid II flippase FtsW [Candidatus Cellulosilyticum pullistercoris]|uniref:Probable peptidoglycan glycosyltransferase FtsW n=1 Tax=Candidatus Cellulosilyticum pullistercoris TaxID=2838521 RepID=A0A9E2KAK4_9FIRM|nr:putative lipid II flippase FtsW [Candidatus Cellulosilyticum pullistercoris]